MSTEKKIKKPATSKKSLEGNEEKEMNDDSCPEAINERNEQTSPDLVDSDAIEFWKASFGDRTVVKNSEFEKHLTGYIKERDKLHVDSLNAFLTLVVERVFWPDASLYSDDVKVSEYVDMYCIQFAINTFGSWKRMFTFIYEQFQDPDLVNPILNLFHGRSRIWEETLETKTVSYLIRYRNKGKVKNGKNQGGLVICYTDNNGLLKTEEVFRKPRHKPKNRDDWIPTGWTWTEKVPVIRGRKSVQRKCVTFEKLLSMHKQCDNFQTPIMFGSRYEELSTFSKKPNPQEEELNNLVNNMNITEL